MKNIIIPNMETNGSSKSNAGILKFSDQVIVSSSEAQEISSKIIITKVLARKRPQNRAVRLTGWARIRSRVPSSSSRANILAPTPVTNRPIIRGTKEKYSTSNHPIGVPISSILNIAANSGIATVYAFITSIISLLATIMSNMDPIMIARAARPIPHPRRAPRDLRRVLRIIVNILVVPLSFIVR